MRILKFFPSALIVFAPVALALRFWPKLSNDTWLFVCSGLAIIPLAGWMGRSTESLANRLGHGVGGLLNATFGNAAELIIALMALSKGYYEVVKASLTGSIIGNLLLVFGCSAFFGGLKFRSLKFNQTAARTTITSLTLAAVALIIPSVFHHAAGNRPVCWDRLMEQRMSFAIAAVLFI